MRQIALIRLSALGDLVHTLPAYRYLREVFPEAGIHWLVQTPGEKLLRCVPGISEIFPLNLRQKITGILSERRRIRRELPEFDAVFDFQGLLKSALLALNLRGRRYGFHRSNLREPLAGFAYQRHAEPFDENRHVIYKNLHLLSAAGIPSGPVRFPDVQVQPSEAVVIFLEQADLERKKFILLNVGGGWLTKRLQVDQWLALIQQMAGRSMALLWGNPSEREVALEISRGSGVRETPCLDFYDLIWLIGQAGVVVSGDTLPLHLADVTETPSVGFFGPTNPARNGSLLPESISISLDMECKFCYRRVCETARCMKELPLERIASAVDSILKEND